MLSIKFICSCLYLIQGCRSLRTGFVTHDEEAKVSYVSTQQPYNPEIFTRIRQACIRSLSCEVLLFLWQYKLFKNNNNNDNYKK